MTHSDVRTVFDADLVQRTKFIGGLTVASLKTCLDEFWAAEDWAVCSAICVEMQFRAADMSDEPKKDDPKCLKR